MVLSPNHVYWTNLVNIINDTGMLDDGETVSISDTTKPVQF